MRTFRIDLNGSSELTTIHAQTRLDETYHFYGSEYSDGITDVPAYKSIVYRNLHDGIDLRFISTEKGLKYEFIVHPGANHESIRLGYEGIEHLSQHNNRLQIWDGGTRLLEDASPVSWLMGSEQRIETLYFVEGTEYGFRLPEYDRTQTLIIDPCIMWSSFFGGSTSDIVSDVASDAGGNLVFSGFTSSIDFPADANALQSATAGSIDAFIVKVDPEGKRMWSTYYGGSGSEDWPRIATDPGNNIVVAGYTSSIDFPVSVTAYQKENGGKIDAFILKLNTSGKRVFATLFGGSFAEECGDVVCDGAGSIFITGSTFSTNLPVKESAYQTSNAGDFDTLMDKEAYIAMLKG